MPPTKKKKKKQTKERLLINLLNGGITLFKKVNSSKCLNREKIYQIKKLPKLQGSLGRKLKVSRK